MTKTWCKTAWLAVGLLLARCPVATAQGPALAAPPAAGHSGLLAAPVPADTARVFSLRDLAALLFANHPVVRQAALLSADGQAQVLAARGGFDPKLLSAFDRKEFGGVDYYNRWTNELKVPIWLGGLDLKASYDRYAGAYINPEHYTPLSGLAGLGVSVPLGQGLLIDARRNTLRQAQAIRNANEADRVKQINEVWLQAAKDYWNWYYAYQQATLLQEGVALADTRFRAISRRVRLGDQAPVDSVEARITTQDRQVQAEQLGAELQNARLVLSNYLWDNQNRPVELPADALPQPARLLPVPDAAYQQLLAQATSNHPSLLKLSAKIQQFGFEERYRRSLLQPKLSVSGTLLSRGDVFRAEVPPSYDFGFQNYKVGFDFALPLFLRQERGKLQQARLKVLDATLERQQEQRTIGTRVAAVYNTLQAYERQLAVQTQTIANQRTLLAAELRKFDLGESTIFLINSRETKLIDLRIKEESLRAGYEKSLAELYYYAGGQRPAE